MFTQSCFIRKNTEGLRLRLGLLGYKPMSSIIRNRDDMLFANFGYFLNNFPLDGKKIDNAIDCGTNDSLFLAIAALRDDTDKYQWFVNKEGDLFKCFEDEFSHFIFDKKDIENFLIQLNPKAKSPSSCSCKPLIPHEDTIYWHKANVQELIEHFKDK